MFNRLRRHRGLWLLAVAVLMIKLVAGTLCLADAPDGQPASSPVAAAAQLSTHTVTSAVDDDSSICLLGEPGRCHCTCAHSATLPTVAVLTVSALHPHFDAPVIQPGSTPAMTGSLLRPPIA